MKHRLTTIAGLALVTAATTGGIALASSTTGLSDLTSPSTDTTTAGATTTGATTTGATGTDTTSSGSTTTAAGQPTTTGATTTATTSAAAPTTASSTEGPTPSLYGLCHAWLAGAGSEHGHARSNPAFTVLVTSAGGIDAVNSYCTTLVASRPSDSDTPESDASETEAPETDAPETADRTHAAPTRPTSAETEAPETDGARPTAAPGHGHH